MAEMYYPLSSCLSALNFTRQWVNFFVFIAPCIIAIKEGSSTFRAAQWNRGKEGSGEVVANFSGLVFL